MASVVNYLISSVRYYLCPVRENDRDLEVSLAANPILKGSRAAPGTSSLSSQRVEIARRFSDEDEITSEEHSPSASSSSEVYDPNQQIFFPKNQLLSLQLPRFERAPPPSTNFNFESRLAEHKNLWRSLCTHKDLSYLTEKEEILLLDRVLVHWQVVDQLDQLEAEKNQLLTLKGPAAALYNRRSDILAAIIEIREEALDPIEANFAQRIVAISQQKNISLEEASEEAFDELVEFVDTIDEQIEEIDAGKNAIHQMVEKEEERIMALAMVLTTIVEAKQQGKDASGLMILATSLLEPTQPVDDTMKMALAHQAKNLKERPAPPAPKPTMLDHVACFYEGSDLIKRDGHFLTLDLLKLSEKEFEEARAVFTEETVKQLLSPIPAGKIVRFKLVKGAIVADPKGPILLSKQAVQDVIDSKIKADFGSRQRQLKKGEELVLTNKEKNSFASTSRWGFNNERKRTAGMDAAQSFLLMKALSEKALTGEMNQVGFNDLVDILNHLDAVAANDLAKLPGSYLSDPRYLARRGILQKIRPILEHSVFAQSARRDSTELLASYKYSWKKDVTRVKVIEEVYRNILLSLVNHGSYFLIGRDKISGAKNNPVASEKLGFFIRGLEDLTNSAAIVGGKLLRAFPHLGQKIITPEAIQEAHLYLQEHEEEIYEALRRFIVSLEDLQARATDLSVGANSPAIQKKLEEFLHFHDYSIRLFDCLCQRDPEDQRELNTIVSDLQNSLVKSQVQSPSTTGLLMKEIFAGTPYSPALIKTLRTFETQKRGFMHQQMKQNERFYELQGKLGYKNAMSHFIRS